MRYVVAFEEAIREIAPNIPKQRLPVTFGGLVDYLKPPKAKSGTALAAKVLIDRDIEQGKFLPGKYKSEKHAQKAYERSVERYRVAEGTSPKGGKQARGAIRGQLDTARTALQDYITDRAVGELRREGVTMRVDGTVMFGGTREAEYALPYIYIPGDVPNRPNLLDSDWEVQGVTDPATGRPTVVKHDAPLKALMKPNMEEAAAGVDFYYWRLYDTEDKIPGYSYTVSVNPGGLSLELGDTTAQHYPRTPRRRA